MPLPPSPPGTRALVRHRSPWTPPPEPQRGGPKGLLLSVWTQPSPFFETAIQPLRPPQTSPATKALGLPPCPPGQLRWVPPPTPQGILQKTSFFFFLYALETSKWSCCARNGFWRCHNIRPKLGRSLICDIACCFSSMCRDAGMGILCLRPDWVHSARFSLGCGRVHVQGCRDWEC